ncbi:hypothetical protein [Methylocucumis oryzae]|nr:hypothetical protein [Methylocucumis oryzae]
MVVDNTRTALLFGVDGDWYKPLLPLLIMAILLFLAAVDGLKRYKA